MPRETQGYPYYSAALDVPTGIPTGGTSIPGSAIVEESLRKVGEADSLYAPLFVVALGVIAILCWLLYRSGRSRETLLERVVVVAEGYKTVLGTVTTALESMKSAQTASNQAVHDLAREAEGEAREGRHGLAQIMMVVTNNAELIRGYNERLNRIFDRGGGNP